MNRERISFLLNSYAANTISREGYDELMHYISQSGTDHELYRFMEATWEEMNEDYSLNDLQSEFLYQKIITDPRFESDIKPAKRLDYSIKPWMAIAASLLLFISIGVGIYYYSNRQTQQAVAYQEKIVPFGKKIQIGLPDGTQVWVNSGSSLKFPTDFTGKKRELYLKGEAYFDVAHDASRPFIIHTGKVITQVLGTAFNVKAYGSGEMSVTVARGKVSVGLSDHLLGVLTPDQCLSYNNMNGLSRKFKADASKLRWMNGELIFNNSKMGEAVETLERWYDVKIILNDPEIKSRQFTTSFLHYENINQVLKVLSEFNHFSYTQDGKNFSIKKLTSK